MFPFTELQRVLEDPQRIAETLKREHGTIVRQVFCYTRGRKTGKGITESGRSSAYRLCPVQRSDRECGHTSSADENL